MYSGTVTFFVSALCALLLPYYVAGEVKLIGCNIENVTPGSIAFDELNVVENGVSSSKLTFNAEVNPSTYAVHVIMNDEDGNSMMEQNIDICSMSASDLFKGYFLSFNEADFNEGNCPIPAGTYNSGSFELDIDSAPEGRYSGTFEILEGPNILFRIVCNAEVN